MIREIQFIYVFDMNGNPIFIQRDDSGGNDHTVIDFDAKYSDLSSFEIRKRFDFKCHTSL